jgi:hypothetical protein
MRRNSPIPDENQQNHLVRILVFRWFSPVTSKFAENSIKFRLKNRIQPPPIFGTAAPDTPLLLQPGKAGRNSHRSSGGNANSFTPLAAISGASHGANSQLIPLRPQ